MKRRRRIICIAVAAWLRPHVAWAHEADNVAAHGPSLWDWAVMLLLVAAALMYAIGALRLRRRGANVRSVERAAFWIGWTAMFAAVAPPIDAASAIAFSSHMAQHELLMLIGAPLMIAGRPIVPWLWALPERMRLAARAPMQNRVVSRAWHVLTLPGLAWAIHGAVVWSWHAPPFYEAALGSEAVHTLQHATFVGTAVLFWWGLIYGRYGRAAYGASALFVFVTMMHTGALGALFALSTSSYYPLYRARAAAAGFDPVADQQLAGVYMWIPSGLAFTVFGLALMLAWLSESDRRSRR